MGPRTTFLETIMMGVHVHQISFGSDKLFATVPRPNREIPRLTDMAS